MIRDASNAQLTTSGLEIYPIKLAEVEVDHGFLVWGVDPGRKLYVPCISYLIKGGDSVVVVDAGIRSIERSEKIHGLPTRMNAEWTYERALSKIGVRKEDVGYVVFTHMHYEHTGNFDYFPNARVVVQREELRYAAAPDPTLGVPVGGKAWWYDRKDLARLIDTFWERLLIIDGDFELMDGIRCVLMRAHTPGSQAVYVETAKGTAIIAGDIVYRFMNVEKGFPTGNFYHLGESMHAIERLQKEGAFILPCHEPEVFERYPVKIPS